MAMTFIFLSQTLKNLLSYTFYNCQNSSFRIEQLYPTQPETRKIPLEAVSGRLGGCLTIVGLKPLSEQPGTN
jgi:hypothetical protein